MESVENKMLKSLKKCGRDTVFFVDRFARLGNADIGSGDRYLIHFDG